MHVSMTVPTEDLRPGAARPAGRAAFTRRGPGCRTDRYRTRWGLVGSDPVAGRVVRVDADPKRPGHAMVGVAFDAPIPEDRLMARVSLARNGARAGRGAQR